MLESIDKNDVNIERLFDWSKKITIKDKSDKDVSSLYIRIIGEADWNQARVWALRDSAALRKKLNNLDSDERQAFIQEMEALDKEALVEFILMLNARDYTQEAIKNVSVPYPKEPASDASLEEQEIYQALIDKYPKTRQDALSKEILNIVEKHRVEYNKMSFKKVYELYEKMAINQLCSEELDQKFMDYCAYFGSYKDSELKERAFNSFEEFDNLPRFVKTQIINAYIDLDLGTSELKK